MNNKTVHALLRLTGATLTLSLIVGCVSGNTPSEKFHSRMRAEAVPLSDFLPHHELLERQPNHFPFHYYYLNPDNTNVYKRAYVAPVDISQLRQSSSWNEFDMKLQGKLGTDVAALAEFMRKAYKEAIAKAFRENKCGVMLTERRDEPDTLVIEPALIAIAPTKAELNVVGTAASFFVLGASVATSLVSSGSITVECRMRDAKTGEIVSMYADTETDPVALFSATQFTWTNSARVNIKGIAAETARVILAAEDYHELRRRFPIRLISPIKDSRLEEEQK